MASAFLRGYPLSFNSLKKPEFRSRNSYLHIPRIANQHVRTRYFFIRPIATTRDNNKGDHHHRRKFFKPLQLAAGASLALACALSIFGCKLKHLNPSAAVARQSAVDMMISEKPPMEAVPAAGIYPLPAKWALRSLFDVSAMLASAKPIPSKGSFHLQKLPPSPSREDIDAIKMEAVRLMKAGKPENAVQLLREANMRFKNEREAEFNVQMALVEILILLGRYEEAAEYSCLSEEPSLFHDVRIPLYKAIVYTMLDEDAEEAKKCWEEFINSIGEGIDPESFAD